MSKGSSYSNAKTLVKSKHYDKELALVCCNLPFDSFSSRLFSTYDGIKYALGKEFDNYYFENQLADSSNLIHGFIAVCNDQKKYLVYNPNNIIIDNQKKKEIYQLLHKIRLKFNSTPYLDISFSYIDDMLKIVKIDCGTDILRNKAIYDFLKEKNVNLSYSEKSLSIIGDKIRWMSANVINYIGRKKGMLGFMYRSWLNGCINDYKSNSIKDFYKIHKAHRKGFFFYHIRQYNLTEENYTEYLSDYEYKRLRPIDGDVWRILWDKPSLYYALGEYKEYIPNHYAVIRHRFVDKTLKMDMYVYNRDNNLEAVSADKLIELIKEKRIVAAKPFVGSHGEGFYKLEYRLNRVFINNQEHTTHSLKEFLKNLKKSYVITEYVNMSEQFKNIYPHAVSTARIMVIKENNYKAKVTNAYVRFANKAGGTTDNVANGGIVASIDTSTGKIVKAEKIENHVFFPVEKHPDTGEKICFKIKNWVQIKNKICEISDYLTQFTYLGFDVAFTEDGFKIIEINTHQDLHKYNEYDMSIKEFLIKMRENSQQYNKIEFREKGN